MTAVGNAGNVPASANNIAAALLSDVSQDLHSRFYDQYLAELGKHSPDPILKNDLVKFQRDLYNSVPATHVLDIGQYSVTPTESNSAIRSFPPATDDSSLERLLGTNTHGTSLRMVFHYSNASLYDNLVKFAAFYEIDTRVIQNELTQRFSSPPYMPSEAGFSPIYLASRFRGWKKQTNIFLVSQASVEFKTVLIFIATDNLGGYDTVNHATYPYDQIYVNRDLSISQRTPFPTRNNQRHLQNDAETCYFRLSQLSSTDLQACAHQPILAVLPLIRASIMESSSQILTFKEKLKRGTFNGNHEEFQSMNMMFKYTVDSLKDHLTAPWLDRSLPHAKYARKATEIAMKDVARASERFLELRENMREYSTQSIAEESIYEARRSVATGETVHQLTRLAFIFIPLTFASSLFGMNIAEWQEEKIPSFGWFVLAAVLSTTLTILAALYYHKAEIYVQECLDYFGGWRGMISRNLGFISWGFSVLFMACIPRSLLDKHRKRRDERAKNKKRIEQMKKDEASPV